MSERDKIMDKIKKCLKLSASSNEHEAAAALRQAQALMEKHDIDHADMLAYEAGEKSVKANSNRKPTNWEAALGNQVADTFGCRLIFTPISFFTTAGTWKFIGVDSAQEIAGYTFEVLLRQCKRARAAHIDTVLRRCKTATKTRRADLFCEGWVFSVAGKITAFVGDERQKAAIDAFVEKKYPALCDGKVRDRNGDRKLSDREYDDFAKGSASGKNAELNRGVDGAAAPLALR